MAESPKYKISGPKGVCGLSNDACVFNKQQIRDTMFEKSDLTEICPYVKIGRIYEGNIPLKCPNLFTPVSGFTILCNNCGTTLLSPNGLLARDSVCPVCGNNVRPNCSEVALENFLRDGDYVKLSTGVGYRYFSSGLIESDDVPTDKARSIISVMDFVWAKDKFTYVQSDNDSVYITNIYRPKCYEGFWSRGFESKYFSEIFSRPYDDDNKVGV